MDLSGRLAGWQWLVLAVLWLPGPVILLWDDYPREEPWRQAFVEPRLVAVESEREAAFRLLAARCSTGDKYNLISAKQRVEYLKCMDARKGEQGALAATYLKKKAAIHDEADQALSRARWRVIGKGVALWLVPLLALFAISLATARARRRLGTKA